MTNNNLDRLMKVIDDLIKYEKEYQFISQYELAKIHGVRKQTINQILKLLRTNTRKMVPNL